jgi:hypothetical protein
VKTAHLTSEFLQQAGCTFHFKKDIPAFSIKPEDFATKPLFVASPDDK